MGEHVVLGFVELRTWMRERKMTLKDFEQLSGVDRNAVWRLLHGQMATVSVSIADRIAKATQGAVDLDQVRAYEQRMLRWRSQQRA